MAYRGHWMQRLADGADLQGEQLPGVPVVEIGGDRRVLIERHMGVTEYSKERICVHMSYGTVCICGCGLELSRMTKQQLVITGHIQTVQLQRRCD